MKERNLGTIISVAVHLCAISLLMVPSLAVQNRPINVVMIDFSLANGPFKKVSPSNGEAIRIKERKLLQKNQKAPGKVAGPDRPIRENPTNEQAKVQVIFSTGTTVATTSDTPNETAIRSAPETFADLSIGIPSSVQGKSILVGVAATHAGYSESIGTFPVQSGSAVGTAGSDQRGGEGRESLAEGGKDYNYIRDAIMKNIRYPESARKWGFEGKVLLSFIVLENGTTSEIKVIGSSGHRLLDESAKEAVAETRITRDVFYRVIVRLPITYRLQGAKDGRT
jgi:periplasmic protein TonB